MNLILLLQLLCGALVIRGLDSFFFLLYNVVQTTFLICAQRLLEYHQTQHEIFKFTAFNQTARLLAKGTYPVLQREKSIAVNNLLLPEDVLLEILARLPVKSLLRFRSVSKSWRDILKEPTFITKHHLTQVAMKDGKCVLGKIGLEDPNAMGFVVEDEQRGIKFTRCELPFLKDTTNHYHQVAGPCNGIFLMSDGFSQLFLWNPATREYKALPPSSLTPTPRDHSFSRVGFGIDPISKDYKVVRVWHFGHPCDREFKGKVEVMSLSATDSCKPKSETWKTIDAVPPIFLSPDKIDQIFANGKYYWSNEVFGLMRGEQYKIVWFDMGAEVFGLILVPPLCVNWYDKLTVVKGSPAVIRHACTVEYNEDIYHMYEIWIIDDYPWTKYATFGPLPDHQFPLGLWSSQEVLVSGHNELTYELLSYDIKTNVITNKVEGLDLDPSYPSVDIYVESLISFAG